MSKACTKCGEVKEQKDFYTRRNKYKSVSSHCRACILIACSARYHADIDAGRAKSREQHWKRRDVANERRSAWSRDNPARVNANVAKRKAFKLQATPIWANEFFIGEAYDLARRRNKLTGIKWEVDHIVPLISPSVCGLHSHTNIAVIPASVNASKGNRYWPDMPRDQ